MQRLEYKERTNEAEKKLWRLFYAQGTAICFYHLHLDPGDRVNVYTPQPGDQVVEDPNKVNELRTITVLAPGGHVRIHCPLFDRPGEWVGSFEKVGGGIVFNAPFDYEGVDHSDWLCVAPPMASNFFDLFELERAVLEKGDTYQFNERTVMIVVMLGEDAGHGFSGEPGEVFTANERTLLAVWELKNVQA